MEFTRENLNHLKSLCRIQCGEEEDAVLLDKLNSSIRQIDEMLDVNTDGVEECCHVIEGIVSPLRDDEVKETLKRDDLLKNTPEQIGGMVRVPPVMKGA